MANEQILIDIKVNLEKATDLRKTIDEAKDSIKVLNKEIKTLQDEYDKLSKAENLNTEALDANVKAQQKAKSEIDSYNKELHDSKNELIEINKATKELNKTKELEAKATGENVGYYEKLQSQLTLNRKAIKAMSEEMLKSEGGKKLINETNEINSRLKTLDKQIGDNQRNVGNYSSAFEKLGSTFKNIAGEFGIGLGIGAVATGLMKEVETMMDFEVAVSRLRAVTGLAGVDLKKLSDYAIELSTSTGIAAKDIIENFTLIGSKQPELLKNVDGMKQMTDATTLLAQAAGMELPSATSNLLDIMNQFGATSEDASKYVNILSDAALKGAAEIPQLADAMVNFGGIAKIAKVDIKESAAMIEVLAATMKTSDPAKIGTGIRNVLTALTAPASLSNPAVKMLREAGVNLSFMSDVTVPLTVRLKELSKIQNDINKLEAVFGKENLEVGIKLLSNVEIIDNLSKGYINSGVAIKQASDNTDNLSHSLSKLGTQWDAFFLSFSEVALTAIKAVVYGFQWFFGNLGESFRLIGSTILNNSYAISKAVTDGLSFVGEKLGLVTEKTQVLNDKQKESIVNIYNKNKATDFSLQKENSFTSQYLKNKESEKLTDEQINEKRKKDTFLTLQEKIKAGKDLTDAEKKEYEKQQREAERAAKEREKSYKKGQKEIQTLEFELFNSLSKISDGYLLNEKLKRDFQIKNDYESKVEASKKEILNVKQRNEYLLLLDSKLKKDLMENQLNYIRESEKIQKEQYKYVEDLRKQTLETEYEKEYVALEEWVSIQQEKIDAIDDVELKKDAINYLNEIRTKKEIDLENKKNEVIKKNQKEQLDIAEELRRGALSDYERQYIELEEWVAIQEQKISMIEDIDLKNQAISDLNIQRTKKELEIELAANQAKLDIATNFFSTTKQLFKESSVAYKALGSAEIIGNTIKGAMGAFAAASEAYPAPYGQIVGAAAAAAVVAQGAVQLAKFNGVEFAQGTVLQGASHANGGIQMFSKGGRYFGEAEGGEAVINKRSTAMFLPQLSAINTAGGGKPLFATGGMVSNRINTQLATNKPINTVQYQPVLIMESLSDVENRMNREILIESN